MPVNTVNFGGQAPVINAVDPNIAQRRQLANLLLQRQLQAPQIRSAPELGARLGATALRQIKVGQEEEAAKNQQQEQLRALAAALAPVKGSPVPAPGAPPGPVIPQDRPQTESELAQSLLSVDPNLSLQIQLRAAERQAEQAAAASKPGAGFSLSAGQTRFDAQGNPIAAVDPRDPTPTNTQKLIELRDSLQGADRATVQGILDRSATITGRTQEDLLASGLPVTDAARSKAAVASADAAANVSQVAGVLGRIQEAGPGAAGLRAILAENVGGLMGQVNKNLGDAVSEGISGLSQEQISGLRADAQAAAVSLIAPFTGEQSGRISESERQIAEDVSRIVNSPTASLDQVQGALKKAITLQFNVLDREAFKAGTPGIDLTNDESINQFGSQLLNFGLNEDESTNLIVDLLRQRQALGFVTGQ